MSNPKTLIFVGGHPDDETFGLGGTLAQYASQAVKIYYISGTRGEVGTIPPELLKNGATPGDIRWAELECAVKTLGLAGAIHLGYRDSGMPGSADNRHPKALAAAPITEVAGRLVKIFRELKPDVVITFDPIGGYRHPDHIAIHNATVQAFHASGDPKQFPEAGAAFKPQKLYFHFLPHGMLKWAVKLMPVFGKDPHKFGKNGDIDLTKLVETEFPVHAVIQLTRQSIETREKAAEGYVSQNESRPPAAGMMGLVARLYGRRDSFIRAYPPPDGKREKDLFDGVV